MVAIFCHVDVEIDHKQQLSRSVALRISQRMQEQKVDTFSLP